MIINMSSMDQHHLDTSACLPLALNQGSENRDEHLKFPILPSHQTIAQTASLAILKVVKEKLCDWPNAGLLNFFYPWPSFV